jgi:hypothetical protein
MSETIQTPRHTADDDRASSVPAFELTILMPCLNEAESLETCVRKAQKNMSDLGIDGEVLVADNGSTDGSPAIADAVARVSGADGEGLRQRCRGGIQPRAAAVVMGSRHSRPITASRWFVEKLVPPAACRGNRFSAARAGAMPSLHRIGNPVLQLGPSSAVPR